MPQTEAKKGTQWSVYLGFSRTEAVGSPGEFIFAAVAVIVWAVSGPVFHYSDTWQLVINTGTTVLTFLIVFVIQHSQNRDASALHLKLDELIKASNTADNSMIDLKSLSNAQMKELEAEYERICARSDA